MKNVSDGGIYAVIPYGSFTQYTPALPEFYWDVYSSEQRIKQICLEIDKLQNYSNYLADKIKDISYVTPEEFAEYQNNIAKIIDALKKQIIDLSISDLQWNVQHGEPTPSVEAQRDMFNDITVHAITVKKLGELDMTVADLANSGLNVRGLAVMSYWLTQKFDLPEGFEVHKNIDKNLLTTSQLNTAKVDRNGVVYIPDEFRS